MESHGRFSSEKMIFCPKVVEIKLLRGNVLRYAAQMMVKIDTEIGQKDIIWMETRLKAEFNLEG